MDLLTERVQAQQQDREAQGEAFIRRLNDDCNNMNRSLAAEKKVSTEGGDPVRIILLGWNASFHSWLGEERRCVTALDWQVREENENRLVKLLEGMCTRIQVGSLQSCTGV